MPAYVPLLAVLAVLLVFPPPIRVPVAGAPVRRALPRRRRVSSADELAWVEALVAELESGRDPASSLLSRRRPTPCVPRQSPWPAPAATSRRRSRRQQHRRRCARWPGRRAAAQGSGTGLAASLATLADAARETERVRGELRTGLAEPRATALVLAGLPALGLMLGAALGADPLSWLSGSGLGRLVLAGGLALEALGVLWSWRIAVSLEATLCSPPLAAALSVMAVVLLGTGLRRQPVGRRSPSSPWRRDRAAARGSPGRAGPTRAGRGAAARGHGDGRPHGRAAGRAGRSAGDGCGARRPRTARAGCPTPTS